MLYFTKHILNRQTAYRKYCINAFKAIILAACIISLAGCSKANEPATYGGFAFDTYVSVTIYDKNLDYSEKLSIATEAVNKCSYYENIFSRTKETAELYKYNEQVKDRRDSAQHSNDANGQITEDNSINALGDRFDGASEELRELILFAENYEELTGGALCIHMPNISDMWSFTKDEHRIPSDEEIEKALSEINENSHKYSEIDLGAIAKGYIADKLKLFLVERGVSSAIIDLGGNILLVGNKQDIRGNESDFMLAVKRPFGGNSDVMLSLKLGDKSVVTSGSYERYFEEGGKLYHHILDPSTGKPAGSGLYSVTIISDSSAVGDALSTACFVLGADKAIELLDSIENACGIFVTDEYEIKLSVGADKYITIVK